MQRISGFMLIRARMPGQSRAQPVPPPPSRAADRRYHQPEAISASRDNRTLLISSVQTPHSHYSLVASTRTLASDLWKLRSWASLLWPPLCSPIASVEASSCVSSCWVQIRPGVPRKCEFKCLGTTKFELTKWLHYRTLFLLSCVSQSNLNSLVVLEYLHLLNQELLTVVEWAYTRLVFFNSRPQ